MYQESYAEWLASAYIILGENSRAIEILERLLARLVSGSCAWIRSMTPVENARFQALLSKYQESTAPRSPRYFGCISRTVGSNVVSGLRISTEECRDAATSP